MKTCQRIYKAEKNEQVLDIDFTPDLILLFVSPNFKNLETFVKELNNDFPKATITGCSTSGEIADINVEDNSVVLNAIKFEKTDHRLVSVNIEKCKNSCDAGEQIAKQLYNEDLRHLLIFSDGLNVNGAELVKGLTGELPTEVSVTGGLAGDGTDFNKTFVINQDQVLDNEIIGIGLYGSSLKIGYSSKGGWDSFGKERLVTKSKDNVLYSLDGQPALDLYKSFLGEKAADLPGSGLLFPLSMRTTENQKPVVRTILGISEEDKSLTFAGSIPEDSYVRLMKANIDRLINGAEDSAKSSLKILDEEAEFALLISCVGRRLVLKQLVEEEVEAVRGVLGSNTIISGFYSYGELAPFGEFNPCQLHNQTMTITTFSER